jgi:hypothetical protein
VRPPREQVDDRRVLGDAQRFVQRREEQSRADGHAVGSGRDRRAEDEQRR